MKDHIIKLKLNLLRLLKSNWNLVFNNKKDRCYVEYIFESEDKSLRIRIFVQKYLRGVKKGKINYINVNWSGEQGNNYVLTQDIKAIIRRYE